MKKLPILSASLLIGSLVITSCSSNKMAVNSVDDNVYFMASDVKLATKYAVDNNNPQSFKNIAAEPTLAEENFSSRNVNPEYISRYQASNQTTDLQEGVLYFDESAPAQNTTGNINAYDNYSSFSNGTGGNGPTINFNMGLGFGSPWAFGSPWGFGNPWGMGFYDPFWNPWGPWGFRPGFSVGIGWGFGNPFWGPSFGMGGFWGPSLGWGYPVYPVRPIYPGNPSFILPGGEYGDRRVVYGARPTRGSSITNSGVSGNQSSVVPSTARAQARSNAAASNSSARRVVSSENSRVATRDFSNSQNDYYNSGRSRVATTRNVNSPAADRSVSTTTRSSVPSARPSSSYTPGTSTRTYTTPSTRGGYSGSDVRTANPSYNRSTNPSYENRSTSPSYNRGTTPSYNRSSSPSYNRSVSPSRSYDSSPSYSAPSRMSTGGSSYSAPGRSSGGYSGGYSGGSAGGSRGGRGN